MAGADDTSKAGSSSHRARPLSGVASVAAVIVLLAFGAFVAYLIGRTDADETTWTRLAWLFASIEAIAFGAAGALFGASVQRQRAERAEDAAERNADGAAKGAALATAIKADAPEAPAGRSSLEAFGPQARGAAESVAARHAEMARALFP